MTSSGNGGPYEFNEFVEAARRLIAQAEDVAPPTHLLEGLAMASDGVRLGLRGCVKQADGTVGIDDDLRDERIRPLSGSLAQIKNAIREIEQLFEQLQRS